MCIRDRAEEVICEYGYDHIVPTVLKAAQVTTGGLTAEQKARAKAKRTMCAQGFYEAETLAFYADADLDMLLSLIHISHPRRPGRLHAARRHQDQGQAPDGC